MGTPPKRASVGRRRRPEAQSKKRQAQQAFAVSEPCEGISKQGPHRSPAQRVRWGKGGDPKHSRRNGKRNKRLPFLSRAKGSPTLVRAAGLEPAHRMATEPKSVESTNSTTPAYSMTQRKGTDPCTQHAYGVASLRMPWAYPITERLICQSDLFRRFCVCKHFVISLL